MGWRKCIGQIRAETGKMYLTWTRWRAGTGDSYLERMKVVPWAVRGIGLPIKEAAGIATDCGGVCAGM